MNANAPPLQLSDLFFEITTWNADGVADENDPEYVYPSESPGKVKIR